MSIDYSKLPRLAELCEAISDRKAGDDTGITVTLEIMTTNQSPQLAVIISSWRELFEVESYYMTSNKFEGHTYTIDEMIGVLQDIKDHAYTSQSEQAA